MFGLFDIFEEVVDDGLRMTGSVIGSAAAVVAMPLMGAAALVGITVGMAMLPLAVGGTMLAEGFGLHLFGCRRDAPLVQKKPTVRGNWSNEQFNNGALRAEAALRQDIPPEIVFAEIRKHYNMPRGNISPKLIARVEDLGCTHLAHHMRAGA